MGFKAGGVGLSRKPGDQTKNSFNNRQIVNDVPFPFIERPTFYIDNRQGLRHNTCKY
jgi:hypothetical protein